MTCIIGLEHGGRVYMGADSAAVSGWDLNLTVLPKVFTVRSQIEADRQQTQFLIGCAGSPRAAQILQYQLSIRPRTTTDPVAYLVREFIEPLRQAMKDYGAAEIENATEATGNGTKFLLGYEGCLYKVDSDFQLARYSGGVAAVGVGDSYAMGAMLALPTRDPAKRILKALTIAGKLCMGVAAPYQVESI